MENRMTKTGTDRHRLIWRTGAVRVQGISSPLYAAASKGHVEVVELLIAAGCKVNSTDAVRGVGYPWREIACELCESSLSASAFDALFAWTHTAV